MDASVSSETCGAKRIQQIRLDLAKKEMSLNTNYRKVSVGDLDQ